MSRTLSLRSQLLAHASKPPSKQGSRLEGPPRYCNHSSQSDASRGCHCSQPKRKNFSPKKGRSERNQMSWKQPYLSCERSAADGANDAGCVNRLFITEK